MVDGVWVMGVAVANNNSSLVKGLDCLGNIKKRCRVERTGAATGEFYCALDATLSVPVRLCLFFSLGEGGCERRKMGRAAGMTGACRGGHGGETRRVKCGAWVWASEGRGGAPRNCWSPSPVNTTRTPPLRRGHPGLKDNEW